MPCLTSFIFGLFAKFPVAVIVGTTTSEWSDICSSSCPPPDEPVLSPTLVLYFPLLSFFIVTFIPSTVTSNGKLLSVKSSFIGFIPSTLFKFVFNCSKFIFPVSSKLAAIAKSTFSFTVALSFCVFAFCAFGISLKLFVRKSAVESLENVYL